MSQSIETTIKSALDASVSQTVKDTVVSSTKIISLNVPYDVIGTNEFDSYFKGVKLLDASKFELTAIEEDTVVYAAFDVEVSKSTKEINTQMRSYAERRAWYPMYAYLVGAGFSRTSSDHAEYKKFDDTTVYDMVINDDYERLISYYKLFFV